MSADEPSKPNANESDKDASETFAKLSKEKQSGLVGEFLHFFVEYRNWWLAPIVVVLLLVSILVVLASTGAAPFIYTLF